MVVLAMHASFTRMALSLLGVGTLAMAACGPSFQVVYEGDARFEHCYALDDTPTVPMQEKTDCWTQWMTNYTYGQTRNRVDYAAMRAKALRDAHAIPTDEALMGAVPGGGIGRAVGRDEPVTTNAFAPPPKTMAEGDAGADQPPPATVAPPLAPVAPLVTSTPPATPHEGCTDRCRNRWQSCHATCKSARCGECDTFYGGCMKRCF